MSEIFLDTETTGLSFQEGHKIVEIACIETKDLIPTNKIFHKLINPERNVPEEAVKIHQDTGSRYSVAIHWGTFILTDEPVDEPPKLLENALAQKGIPNEHFFVMQHGETRSLNFLFQ